MTARRAERVEVAPGDGLLARRVDAIAFVAGRSPASVGWGPALEAFVDAPDRDTALTGLLDHAVDQHLEVGPFTVVVWDVAVHLVVFGDLTVTTDLASVPRLSGAGMPSWVEHRATRVGERAEVRLGDAPSAVTDLRHGIVAAGGFRLLLTTATPASPPPVTAPVPAPATSPPTPSLPNPVAPPPPAASPPLSTLEPAQPPAPAPAGGASWDVLRDAGGAWMDESLRLSEPRLAAAASPNPPAPPAAAPAPAPPEASTATTAEPFDPELTLDAGGLVTPPAATAPSDPAPLARYVQARRCELGHLNPPLRTQCRVCAGYVPPATPVETVPQPALATLVLGDGRTVDVSGPVVLGRTPSADAARLDEPGTLVALAEPTVSRTHAIVTVDGWTLLAIDCGATGGTAITRTGGEPTLLEPWVPHELAVGDTLFLGGPTQVQVVARTG